MKYQCKTRVVFMKISLSVVGTIERLKKNYQKPEGFFT